MKAAAQTPIAARVKAAARTPIAARVKAAARMPIAARAKAMARARMKIRIANAGGEKKRKFPKRKSLNFACRFCHAGQERHVFISFLLTFLRFFPSMLFLHLGGAAPLFVLRTFFPFHRKNSQVRMTRKVFLVPCHPEPCPLPGLRRI